MKALALLLVWAAAAAAQEPPRFSAASALPSVTQQIVAYSWTQKLTVSGGPGGPRDYVGLHRIGDDGTIGPRLAWKYLDDTRDFAKHSAMNSGPTEGQVTFAGLAAGRYEARFFRDASSREEDLLVRMPFQVGPLELELLHRDPVDVASVVRLPAGGFDELVVRHADGRQTTVRLDKNIVLQVRRANLAPAAVEAKEP